MWMRERSDRGQALPLMLIAVAVTVVGLMVVVRWGAAVDDAARARTAADAAALAGAAEGRVEAEKVASANGGQLLEYRRRGDTVEVVVAVRSARARARAEAVFEWVPSGTDARRDE